MDIKSQYLIVAFINKIIVCDVYTLKHLFKIETGDDDAIFDSYLQMVGEGRHELRIAHTGEDDKKTFTI